MSRHGLVGSGSDMPINSYLKKIEQTCMYESPDMVDTFHRNTLKDMRPCKDFFESDQPRGGRDSNGKLIGNNISTKFLNFRDSGFMSAQGAEPFLPDGTFLDHVFLEKDPRGVALEPNMRKHVEQQYARKSFINFKPDNNDTVTESGIAPSQMVFNIRSGQKIIKDYMKIFDTSWDSWSTANCAPSYTKSNVDLIENSSDIKDPAHLANRNQMNITNSLSNDTSIGFRRTTDHVFQVEQYGKTNIGSSFTDSDWYKNRANAHVDHDILMSWQDTKVSKGVALTMMDLAHKKENSLTIGNGIVWGKSNNNRGIKQKLTSSDMAGIQSRQTEDTQPSSAHSRLKGDANNISAERTFTNDPSVMGKTQIKTTIYEIMGMVNKDFKKDKTDDLRNQIEKSAKNHELYIEDENSESLSAVSNKTKSMWDSVAIYKKGDDKTIMNYRACKAKNNKLESFEDIEFDKKSKIVNQRRGRLDKNSIDVNTGLIDNKIGMELDKSKQTGPMGSKYMNRYMDVSGSSNDINDR